jgi:nucleotide-binding universal stress UspA family protein
MFSGIVVGTDGSETAAKAVGMAIEMAAVHGSRMHVVAAYEAVLPALSQEEREALGELAWMASPGELAERLVAEASERAAAAGVETETHVRTGDAAHALIESPRRRGGPHRRRQKALSSPARFLLSSLPSKVAPHAPCHVLSCAPPEAATATFGSGRHPLAAPIPVTPTVPHDPAAPGHRGSRICVSVFRKEVGNTGSPPGPEELTCPASPSSPKRAST